MISFLRSLRFPAVAAALLSSQLLEDSSIHRLRSVNPSLVSGTVQIESTFTPIGGSVLFAARDNANGEELWTSDGTAAGTHLVRDLQPRGDGSPAFLTVLGERVLFFAQADGVHLWQTDGTTAGTQLVTPLAFNTIYTAGRVGATLYFSDLETVPTLWKSDGTEAGTVPVATFSRDPLKIYYFPYDFVAYGDAAYFFAMDDAGLGLWKTDGTAAGTTKVKDLGPVERPGAQPGDLVRIGDTLCFVSYLGNLTYRLWRSDGTPDGTVGVRDFVADPFGTSPLLFPYVGPQGLTVLNGVVLFAANDGVSGRELWRTDGTPQGTALVRDIRAGPRGANIFQLVAAGGKVYFGADDGISGNELWESDGTEAGTHLVKDIAAGAASSAPRLFVAVGGIVYFAPQGPSRPGVLWRSDGTEAGTFALTEDLRSADPLFVGAAGSFVFFSAGSSLWKTDGTREGTVLVSDFPGSVGPRPGGIIAPAAGHVFFVDEGDPEGQLWASDGTEAGTHPAAGLPPDLLIRSGQGFAVRGGDIYFIGYELPQPPKLWKSDGSRSTLLSQGSPSLITATSDLVFFWSAGLWKTDGTVAGTAMVKDFHPGVYQNIGPWLGVGRLLFFWVDDGVHGHEPWKSDGTPEGTQLIKDLRPGPEGSNPIYFTASNGYVFFAADDGGGYALWKTDGTESGTLKLAVLVPSKVTASGGLVYFTPNFGTGLWRSDGTPEGTFPIKQILVTELTDVRGTLFFAGNDGVSGWELWKSDGTAEGTVLVRDIMPGPLGSDPSSLVDAGGVLLFAASDGAHGTELWRSDGTEAGTFLRMDIHPGVSSSRPEGMKRSGPYVYFFADDGSTGRQIWIATAYDARLPVTRPAEGPRPLPFRR